MRYLPHTQEEINEMLAVVGQKSLDDLFVTLPAACRYQGDIDLPPAMTEWQLLEHTSTLADAMKVTPHHVMMIGAGSYSHFVPETVKMLAGRSEFLTAYTPYQPEMAQGTLQGIYEYQTLTARLLGMDVANASLYDGASALAEALLMGIRVKKKKKTVAVSGGCHPHHRQVVKTYFSATEYTVIELPLCSDGRTDLSELARYPDLAAVALQSPNFFGVIEDLEAAASHIHGCDALFITSFTEPFAYGIYKSPGACGADIACGDGQSFGLAKSMGGAGLGMFACRNEFVRSMPGRLVGTTLDLDGRRGFVLTLSTREQHIRLKHLFKGGCHPVGGTVAIGLRRMFTQDIPGAARDHLRHRCALPLKAVHRPRQAAAFGLEPGGQRIPDARREQPRRSIGDHLTVDQNQNRVRPRKHHAIIAAILAVDDGKRAGRRIRRRHRRNRDKAQARTVRGRPRQVDGLAAAHADHHFGRGRGDFLAGRDDGLVGAFRLDRPKFDQGAVLGRSDDLTGQFVRDPLIDEGNRPAAVAPDFAAQLPKGARPLNVSAWKGRNPHLRIPVQLVQAVANMVFRSISSTL